MGRPVASPPAWGPRIHLPAPLTAGFADRAGRPPVPEVRGPQAGRAAAREGLRGKLPHLRRAQRERPLPQCLGRVGSGAPRCRPALFWSPRLHRGPLTGTRSPWGQAWLQVPTALCPRAGQCCSGGGGVPAALGAGGSGARGARRERGAAGCGLGARQVSCPQDKLDGFVPAHFLGWYLKVRRPGLAVRRTRWFWALPCALSPTQPPAAAQGVGVGVVGEAAGSPCMA